MSAAFAAMLSVAAVLLTSYASRRRTVVLAAISALLILGALFSIGQPELRSNDGFIIEPSRAYAAMAILLAVGGVALAKPLTIRRVGLVAASSLLALFGGHAGVVLAALLASTCALGLIAWTARPSTLHASVPERTAMLLLLGADILVGLALVIEGSGFLEPMRVQSVWAAGIIGTGIWLRLSSALALRDPLTVLAVAAPVIALLTWIPDPAGIIVAVSPLAAWAAWRATRSVDPASAVLAWTCVAVCMAAVGNTSALLLLPFLLLVAVVWVTLHDVAPAVVLLSAAAPGLGGYALATSVVDQLAIQGAAVSLAGLGLAIALLLVAAFRVLRPIVSVESLNRRILVFASSIALLVSALLPAKVLAALAGPIADLREPGRMSEITLSRPAGVLTVLAIAVLWFLFERAPLRVLVPEEGPVVAVKAEVARVSMGEPPALVWQRAVIAAVALAAILVVGVLALSASKGWL